MTTPREIELKLELDPADAGRVKRHLARACPRRKSGSQPLVSVYFDLAAAKDTPLESLLNGRGTNALEPLFETRVRRSEFRVGNPGSQIAVALDEGRVDTG